MSSHEVLDELEYQFRKEDHLEVTLHYDPIVTDDPELNGLRQAVDEALHSVDPRLSAHDVRMVKGERQSNLIFDVLLPFGDELLEDIIREKVQSAIHSDTHRYVPVINFDVDLAGYTKQ